MGYTHYWRRPKAIAPIPLEAAASDFLKLMPEFKRIGLVLAGPNGTGDPAVNPLGFKFNGVRGCRHKQQDLGIAWPADSAGGLVVGAGRDVQKGTWFAGAQIEHRTCDGDCSHESFWVEQKIEPEKWQTPDEDGLWFEFCKTAYKPYDLAVTSALIVLHHHLAPLKQFKVSSDGENTHWFDAALLCHRVLGYGLGFTLGSGE